VLAYEHCESPGDRSHGPALEFPSCSSPQQSSSHLTVGTRDANGAEARSNMAVRMTVLPGDPDTPGDQADVRLTVTATDVRERPGLGDYAGEVLASALLRVTDRSNAAAPPSDPFDDPATVQDVPLSFDASCQPTTDNGIGSSCESVTTADAVVPGVAVEGRRAIWEVGQVELYDGGSDGAASTADNTVLARQGVFVP
jgi:hypothetical protein